VHTGTLVAATTLVAAIAFYNSPSGTRRRAPQVTVSVHRSQASRTNAGAQWQASATTATNFGDSSKADACDDDG